MFSVRSCTRPGEKKYLIKTKKKKHLFFEERFWKIGYFVFVIFGKQRDLGHHQVIFDKVAFLSIIYW